MKSHNKVFLLYIGVMVGSIFFNFLEIFLTTSSGYPIISLIVFVGWGISGPSMLLHSIKTKEAGTVFLRDASLIFFSAILFVLCFFRISRFQTLGWHDVKSIPIFMLLCFVHYKLSKWFYLSKNQNDSSHSKID